jgi:hypothetical protein
MVSNLSWHAQQRECKQALLYRDHVPAPEGYDEFIETALRKQRDKPVGDYEKTKCNGPGMAARNWDIFYKNNQVRRISPA